MQPWTKSPRSWKWRQQKSLNYSTFNIAEIETPPSSNNQQLLDSAILPNSATKSVTDKKEHSVAQQDVLTHSQSSVPLQSTTVQRSTSTTPEILNEQHNETRIEDPIPKNRGSPRDVGSFSTTRSSSFSSPSPLDAKEEDTDPEINRASGGSSDLINQATPTKQASIQEKSPSANQQTPQIQSLLPIPPSPAPDTTDDATLWQHIQLLEKELYAGHAIMQLQHHEITTEGRPGETVIVEIQANLENKLNRRAEAEDKWRMAKTE
jgi:hypothetical protein